MNKTLQAHLDAIRVGEVTKTNVIGLRKAFNLDARAAGGWGVPRYVTPAWRDDVGVLGDALADCPSPTVTGELHDTGLAVLRNKRYAKRWTQDQASIIAELDHFKLVGFEFLGRRGEYAQPIYRAVGHSGLGFDFMNVPWQSGGDGPKVVY